MAQPSSAARRAATCRTSGVMEPVHDAAVGQEDDGVGTGSGSRVMGDHRDGLPPAVDQVAQHRQHQAGRRRVESAGRLVGEQDGGLGHQRSRDGDALLLATGELPRAVTPALGQPHRGQHLADPRLLHPTAGEPQRESDVLGGGEGAHQVVGLEAEADLGAP